MHALDSTPVGPHRETPTISLTKVDLEKSSSSTAPSARHALEGAPSSSCYVAELCAGSAGLSFSLSRAGFSTVTVDHAANRHKSKVPCVKLDLSLDSGWKLLYDLLDSDMLLYVHGAPPCGTASRAREKQVPLSQIARGAPTLGR